MANIYVYSPSGAVQDRRAFKRGLRRLAALGHEVEVDPDALTRWQRFAGDDETRLAAIGRAATSGADLAMISRGGYGFSRILGRMPWDTIAGAIADGTHFLGFSDFTTLQLGLLARGHQGITWAGPALCEGFGQKHEGASSSKAGAAAEGLDEIMLACFDDMLAGHSEGTGWRLGRSEWELLGEHTELLAKDAVLWGGNLAMLVSLLGTPWFPAIQGGVLFLEDIGEHPYRVERMLIQLLEAGVLDAQSAILLGQFSGYRLSGHDRGYNFRRMVDWLRPRLSVPLLTGLPFGHLPTKVLLPVGARVTLIVERQEALLLWGHLG